MADHIDSDNIRLGIGPFNTNNQDGALVVHPSLRAVFFHCDVPGKPGVL